MMKVIALVACLAVAAFAEPIGYGMNMKGMGGMGYGMYGMNGMGAMGAMGAMGSMYHPGMYGMNGMHGMGSMYNMYNPMYMGGMPYGAFPYMGMNGYMGGSMMMGKGKGIGYGIRY